MVYLLSVMQLNINYCNLNQHMLKIVGRDSLVGIATGYGLDSPGIESR